MKDLHITPDENLEARITAWVLGEASPFEAAELEALCSADPELQLFLNRTRTIHSLLLETPTSDSEHFWKLSPPKREMLDPIIGPNKPSRANKNSSRPRAAYRKMFGIAAVLALTLFIKQFFFSPSKDLPLTMASASSELNSEMPATGRTNIVTHNDVLAGGNDFRGSSQPTIRARLGNSGGEKVGDNLQPPAPASDASAFSDQLAMNENLLEKESLHGLGVENTSEKDTSSTIVPGALAMADASRPKSTLKSSPPTDATAGLLADDFDAVAQTNEDKATFEFNRDTKPDDAIAAKSLESNRLLMKGQPIVGASSAKSLQTAPEHDAIRKDSAPEKRELLSSHATVAKFIGIKDHRCMGLTGLCPDRCGDSGKLATFEIIEYLDYQKPGEYGDPKQTTFHVLIRDNQGSAKIPDEILSIIDSLKPNTKVKLSWRHEYVTKDKASFPERPVTQIEAEQ